MARYRVGEEGVRVIRPNGTYSLPPGAVISEIPERYEGKLIVEELDEVPQDNLLERPIFKKRLDGYADKAIRAQRDYSDKST